MRDVLYIVLIYHKFDENPHDSLMPYFQMTLTNLADLLFL